MKIYKLCSPLYRCLHFPWEISRSQANMIRATNYVQVVPSQGASEDRFKSQGVSSTRGCLFKFIHRHLWTLSGPVPGPHSKYIGNKIPKLFNYVVTCKIHIRQMYKWTVVWNSALKSFKHLGAAAKWNTLKKLCWPTWWFLMGLFFPFLRWTLLPHFRHPGLSSCVCKLSWFAFPGLHHLPSTHFWAHCSETSLC